MSDAASLSMIRLRFSMPRLIQLGRRRGLPLRDVDEGYLVHCQLGELFGELAPHPFALSGAAGRSLDVLAYSRCSGADLRRQADSFADPAVHAGCDWDAFASKPMPTAWRAGTRLGFTVRVCPVVRMNADGPKHRKGAEVDAFLARTWAGGDGAAPDREGVYRDWLAAQVDRRGGARLVRAGAEAFRLGRLVRRTRRPIDAESRRAKPFDRPDVTMSGELEVTDAASFGELLRTGVGRHRSFGFGMLLLRPPGRAARGS